MPEQIVVGWREWVCVPALHLRPLKAKIDSGAKTCALHAFYVEPFQRDDQPWVRFGIHPRLNVRDFIVHCESPLIDRREVTDSGGHRELRCVIETTLQLGNHSFSAEVTLTDRETLQYRMLIGRNALRERFLVDSTQSFALGKPPNGAGLSAGKPL
jgi:hypothetical protein